MLLGWLFAATLVGGAASLTGATPFASARNGEELALERWSNQSAAAVASVLTEAAAHRSLLAYAKLGKISTLSFVHISRTGGLSFNKLLVENRGIAGRDGNRIPDCIVPRSAYGNQSLPLSARFDFPHCEILSAIWPLPTVQVRQPEAPKCPCGLDATLRKAVNPCTLARHGE